MTSESERLGLELEAAALRAVRATYSDLNETFFKGRLVRPSLEFTDTTSRLGRWIREWRRIELSRTLLVRYGWGTLIEVLKHEMAHQYTDELMSAFDEGAHGPTFRRVCDERGFDARAVGIPEASSTHHAPILDRVAKLLALAESSNEHEAQAAMNAAQRLMLKHNLEGISVGRTEALAFRHLGVPTGRVSEAERILANILSEHFFVDAIWVPVWRAKEAKRGSVLEICGRLENVEMADYVYSFLMQTSARLWVEHKKARGIRENRDRRAYVAGVMAGFRQELQEQQRRNTKEGLVWVGDPEVGEFFHQRHPRVRWTRHVSSRGTSAHEHGIAAGRRIVLHRGIRQGPSDAPVRLLKR